MKTILMFAGLSLAATAAVAEPVTRTTTFEGPKVSGTRTGTTDAAAGTYSRSGVVTRKSDGATATRDFNRARTDTGVTASGSATGFGGKTRSYGYDRTRTETGSVTSGTATGRNGQSYTLSGQRTRNGDGTGYTANQSVVNSSGAVVYNRDVAVARANGQRTRSVTATGPAGGQRARTFRRSR